MVNYIAKILKRVRLFLSQNSLLNLIYFLKKSNYKQQLYIHVGMPKTGSSAIQAFLALNKRYLLKHDFSYPNHTGFKQAFQTSSGNATDMFKWIKNENTNIFNIFLKKTKTKNIILSSEILFVILKENPEKFANFLHGRSYKIICYIREFGDLIESCINQQIKNHYLVDYLNIDNITTSFDYYGCLLKAKDYINIDNIIVKKYGNKYFYNNNIYADFMNTIGLKLDDEVVYPEKSVNPSLNRDALELRMLLNKSFFGKKNINQKYNLNGILAKYSVDNSAESNAENMYPLLTPELRTSIALKYAEIEKKFTTEYFIDSDTGLFNQKQASYNKYGGLSVEHLSKILSFIKQNDLSLFNEIVEFVNKELKNNDDRIKILKASKTL